MKTTTVIVYMYTRVQLHIQPEQIMNIGNRKKKASRIRLLCQEPH